MLVIITSRQCLWCLPFGGMPPFEQLPILPVPDFSVHDYHIDPQTGFLPNPPPLERLPLYYEPWETIMDSLNGLLLAGQLRSRVIHMPELSTQSLQGWAHYQRAYVVLTFIAHSFIIGIHKQDTVESILPSSLAKPWFSVSKYLGVKPIVNYAGVDLWNWKLLDPHQSPSLKSFKLI